MLPSAPSASALSFCRLRQSAISNTLQGHNKGTSVARCVCVDVWSCIWPAFDVDGRMRDEREGLSFSDTCSVTPQGMDVCSAVWAQVDFAVRV